MAIARPSRTVKRKGADLLGNSQYVSGCFALTALGVMYIRRTRFLTVLLFRSFHSQYRLGCTPTGWGSFAHLFLTGHQAGTLPSQASLDCLGLARAVLFVKIENLWACKNSADPAESSPPDTSGSVPYRLQPGGPILLL